MIITLMVTSVTAEEALMMPRASQSLLLDAVSVGGQLVAVGERGHILKRQSLDADWQQQRVPTRQMLTSVCFSDTQRGWAVGHDGLVLVTVDGGQRWVVQYDGLEQQAAYNQKLLMEFTAEQSALERELEGAKDQASRDALGETLELLAMDIEDAQFALESPAEASPLLDVYCMDALRVFAVGAFGTFLYTRDGGVSWQRADGLLDNPEQLHLNSITGASDGRLWVAGESGQIFYSPDAGQQWQSVGSPYVGSFFGIEREHTSGALLVFGLRGNAFLSCDDGQSWSAASVDGPAALAGGVWINASYALLVGNAGNVQLSADGGKTFRKVTMPERVNLSGVALQNHVPVVVGQGGSYALEKLGAFGD